MSHAAEPTPNPTPLPGPRPFRIGPALKLVGVGALLIAMLLPQVLINDVVRDRESYQDSVKQDIARSWGPPQAVLGPVLVIPTRTRNPRPEGETAATAARVPAWTQGSVVVFPSRLRAEVRLSPERRRRGLFEAVIYEAALSFSAALEVPPLDLPAETEALWGEAHLLTGARDLRAADDGLSLLADGRALTPAAVAETGCPSYGAGRPETIRWRLDLGGAPREARTVALSGTLPLRGTGGFHLMTAARRTEVEMTAPWPTPSFTGTGLPVRSEVTETGFRASWSEAGPRTSLHLPATTCVTQALPAGQVGVELLEAVPTYRMVTRASKYSAMFLALSFLTYVLFELVGRVRIHLVQYGLLGSSVVLFPLLLLSFGEPLGFTPAYAISTAAVVAQASLYTLSVTRRPGLALTFAGVLSSLFGFLYVVLNLESYAMLTGAVALFAALSAVMIVTRRVEWSGR